MSLLRITLATAALVLSISAAGCYDEEAYGPPETPEAESEEEAVVAYRPAYYDGYVVYYDTVGRPYYYDRGVVVWVSPGSAYYPGLVHHYHVYGPYYGAWYTHSGYRYRAYRHHPGHYEYRGYGGYRRGGGRRRR